MATPLRRPVVRLAVGAATAVVGFGLTAAVLVALQRPLLRTDTDIGDAVSFDTPPPAKKPPVKRAAKPKPKPRPRPSTAPPPPSLGSALAGLSFGLPQLGDDVLGGATESMLGQRGDTVMPEDAVDEPPRAVQRAACTYPSRARAQNVEGFVRLSLLVAADGTVSDVRILEARPPGAFESVATDCIRGWRFEAATYQGRSVSVRARQTLRFELGE